MKPREAIDVALKVPGKVYVGYVQDTPTVLFGLGLSNTIGLGHPWLLSTEGIRQVPYTFTRTCLRYVDEFLEDYPILTNLVDSRNTLHLQWIRRMGFRFIKDWPNMGPGRITCKQFIKIKG